MTDTTTERPAPAADLDGLVVRHRVELLAHCYRLLGSWDEAEDAVQETFLRAHRFLGTWEGRSSMRTWLYRIATNTCLDGRRARSRRPLPSDLAGPSRTGALARPDREIPWLEPIPDHVLHDERADPAAQVAARAGMRLAFVAALQHLSPVQRAVLILRDVLKMPAAEVAGILDLTVPSVNNHLQRARKRLPAASVGSDMAPAGPDPGVVARADDYARAFLHADVDGLVALLHADVTLEMPPIPTWFRGAADVGRFLGDRVRHGPWRALATAANTQPAFVLYAPAPDGSWRAESLHVLALGAGGVRGVVVFREPHVLAGIGLPCTLDRHPHDKEVTR